MSGDGEPGRALLLDSLLSEADIRDRVRAMLHSGLVSLKSDAVLRWEPFISAFVEACSTLGSLAAYGVTLGQKCVSLQFVNTAKEPFHPSVVLACLEEPLRLLVSNLGPAAGSLLAGKTSQIFAEKWTEKMEALLRLCRLLNILVFLVEGRYPTVWLRLLGLLQTPATRETFHAEDFTNLGREALWHTFRESVSVVLPFAQLVKTYLSAHVIRRFGVSRTGVDSDRAQQRGCEVCALCGQSPPVLCVVFVKSDCLDGFCYSCVMGEPLINGGFVCPRCKWTVRLDCAVFNCTGLPLP